MVPSRSKLLLSAVRTAARELRRANPPVGAIQAVPAKGTTGGARRGPLLGHVVRYGLWLAVVGSVLAFFLPAADRLGSWKGILELVVGAVLTGEGVLLVSNWHGARWRLVQRWVDRAGRPAGVLDALRWRTFGYLLFGLGLAWLAVGVIELGQGLLDLV